MPVKPRRRTPSTSNGAGPHQQTALDAQIAAARSGDREVFSALVEPYRRELLLHCYRLLGSLESAEDMVQDTFLRAWQHLERFEGGALFRAWLYKIATNACLDVLARQAHRILPPARYAPADPREPATPPIAEPIWLGPFPDALLPEAPANPEAQYLARERITLAFIVALHLLPPRQRAILILRDVLDWPAREVAAMLDLSESAVTSALHRARTTLRTKVPATHLDHGVVRVDAQTRRLLERYVRAWERDDVDALAQLLHEEARLIMPPRPSWYQGREAIGAFLRRVVFDASDEWRLLPTGANAQAAFGVYQRDPAANDFQAHALQVLTFADQRITEVTIFFSPALFDRFGLPPALPGDAPRAR
jgi:RNA polymerase sigma-70 factor (ECF subfamily)